MNANLAKTGMQSLRFGAVGFLNTGIDLLVFVLLYQVLGLGLVVANVVSYGLGTLNGFFLNKFWTFSETRLNGRVALQLPLYLSIYMVGLLLSTATLWVLAFMMPVLVAKVLALAVSMVSNFFLSRRFVYGAVSLQGAR
jgi:putative flippase GtrA